MTRRMLRRTLQAAGCTCDEAEDGAQAVQRVQMKKDEAFCAATEKQYDVILMDFVMVRVSGCTACVVVSARKSVSVCCMRCMCACHSCFSLPYYRITSHMAHIHHS